LRKIDHLANGVLPPDIACIKKGRTRHKVLTDPDLRIGLANQTNSPKLALSAATYIAKLYNFRLKSPAKFVQIICD